MKQALFLGASNTHGVSLHFFRELYKDINNVRPEWPYTEIPGDKEFIEEHRFATKLSNYLNVQQLNYSHAGGSPAEALHILSKTDLTNVEYIFFELSCIYSYFDRFFHTHWDYEKNKAAPRTPTEIEAFLTNGNNDDPELKERIIQWLIDFNPKAFMKEIFSRLVEFIKTHPHIKFTILIWREDLDSTNTDLDFLQKYIVKFPIRPLPNNILVEPYLTYHKLRVCDEFEHIGVMKFPEGHSDLHPSLNGHQRLFEILKNHINEKNNTNTW